MTFTEAQQKANRKAFIEECRQKAWGAACHADWISKNIDELLAQFTKLQEQDRQLEADVKELESALDSHTVDNRNKRKALNEKRGEIARQKEQIAGSAQQGQKAMQQLLQSVESALALATHAEGWEWKEVEPKPAPTAYCFIKVYGDHKIGEVRTAEELGDGAILKQLIEEGYIEPAEHGAA